MKSRHPLRKTPLTLALLLGFVALSTTAFAQFTINISTDEAGNGRFTNSNGFDQALPGVLAPDPGPGGLLLALTYNLLNPPGLTAGDVLMLDSNQAISDVIRFNASNGTLVFYSLLGGGLLGDTGFPTANYTNILRIDENPLGATVFTPIEGQPGFVAEAAGPVTYSLTSAESVPDSGTAFALLGLSTLMVFSARKFTAPKN